ncbi:hypothetical protein BKI52_36595 [marine bacterium AO1-C]|nr:hypothetical protein BKI52_36595 [marine bacterium AO1-C]
MNLDTKIGYRPANGLDVDLAYQIKSRSLKPYVEQIWGWNEPFQAKAHQEKFDFKAITFITYNESEIGFYELVEKDNILTVANILITDQHQSRGIGKIVMDKICKRAQAKKCNLRLQVFKINIRAQQFYKSNGFYKIGETPHHYILQHSLTFQ